MAVVDYEAAWVELLDLVASQPGWGSAKLTAEAARIAARHRVEESLLERVYRLYGEGAALAFNHQGKAPSASGSMLTGSRGSAPTSEARGGHDGIQHDPEHP